MVDHVPLPLLTHAYETTVALVLMGIALPVVSGGIARTSIHAEVPGWLALMWGWALLGGALLTLWGLFTFRPRLEWGGQLFLGYSLSFYAAAIALNTDWDRGGVSVLVFGGLGAVAFWRTFKVTSQSYVQHRLMEEARRAHVRSNVERRNRER